MAIPYYANNIYDLHGITRPEAKCKKCGKQYKDHDRREHDQNGWVLKSNKYLKRTSDWPYFNPSNYTD